MSDKSLSKLRRIIEEFRKMDPEMPSHHAMAFLLIASEEGQSQIAISRALGLSRSAMQRVFDKLSDKGMDGRPPLGLIEGRRGALDPRENCAFLTPAGRRVVEALSFIVEA